MVFISNSLLIIIGLFTVHCAESRPCYFAKRLHKAISGAGTRDRCLIRIVVTHSDIDMGNIKMEYEKLYGRSLASDISVIFLPYSFYFSTRSNSISYFYLERYVWRLQEGIIGSRWIV